MNNLINANDTKKLLAGLVSAIMVLSALAVMVTPVFATSTTNNDEPSVTVGPGATNVPVMDFSISSGADENLAGAEPDPGTSVTSTNPWKGTDQVAFNDANDTWESGSDAIVLDYHSGGKYSASADTVINAGAVDNRDDGDDLVGVGASAKYWDNGTGNGYDAGDEVFLDDDQDDVYTSQADNMINSHEGTVESSPGDDLKGLGTSAMYWDKDSSTTYDPGDEVFIDDDDDTYYTGQIDVQLIGVSLSTVGVTTSITATNPWSDVAFYNNAADSQYSGADAIYDDLDKDGLVTDTADTLADANGSGGTTFGGGGAASISAGDPLKAFDATDNVYLYDEGTDGLNGGNDILWIDGDDDGATGSDDTGDTGDTVLIGTAAATAATTELSGTRPIAYNDADTDGTTGDGIYQDGQDIYVEETAGALTYSANSDTKLAGANLGAGTSLQSTNPFTTAPQVAFWDDGNSAWESGSDIIVKDYHNGGTISTSADSKINAGRDGTYEVTDGTASKDIAEGHYYAVDIDGNNLDEGDEIVEDFGGSGTYSAAPDTLVSTGDNGTIDASNTDDLTDIAEGTYKAVDSNGNSSFDAGVDDDIVTDDDSDTYYTAQADELLAGTAPSATTSVTNTNPSWKVKFNDVKPKSSWVAENDSIVLDADANDAYLDQLNTATFQNTGSATKADFASVEIWVDNGDGSFDASADTKVGTAVWDGTDSWENSSLSVDIPSAGKRFFVTVDIAADTSGDDDIKMKVPVYNDTGDTNVYDDTADEGLFLASNLNNSVITNANTQTIDAPIMTDATAADLDNDAMIDELTITFEENMDISDPDGATDALPGMSIDKSGVSIADGDYAAENTKTLVLEVSTSEVYTGTLDVTYDLSADTINDDDGPYNLSNVAPSLKDSANPVLLHAEIDVANSDASTNSTGWGTASDMTVLDLTFSESVSDSDSGANQNPDVTIAGSNYDFDTSGASTLSVGMGSVLQTGGSPQISATDLNDEIDDGNGNSPVLQNNENVVVNTFRRTLDAGWNYVSFPIADYHEYPIGDYFSDNTKVDVVWTYSDGTWNCYNPDYEPADEIKVKGGYGYIENSLTSMTLTPNIYNMATGEPSVGAPMERSVSAGWNLIGQYQEFNQTQGDAFHNLTTSFGSIKGMSGGNLVSVGDLVTGNAYWAFADADGTYAEGNSTGN